MSDSFFCYRFIGGASRIAVGFICTFICYSVQSCDNNKATAVQRGVVIIRPFLPEKKVPAFGVMLRPSTVRVNKSTGNVFILDEGNHRILEFGSGVDFIKQIGGIGQIPEQFLDPCDFALDNRGSIYVVD